MATNIEADANIGSYRSLNDSDLITNAKANVSIFGGVGNDTIRNSADNVTISGENGNDIINNADALGWGNNLVLNGGDGDDTLMSGTSNVTMIGGSGKDIFDVRFYNKTTASSIVIDDYNSNEDKLKISVGSLTGGEVLNNDVIFYNKSHKVILKNAKGKAITTVDAKGNESTAVYGSNSTSVPTYDITYDSKGNAIIKNRYGNEKINSGIGNDSIYNSGYSVTIDGGNGNDTITNYGYAVTINGGDGDDSIENNYRKATNLGNVTITGGKGNDTILNKVRNVTIDSGDGNDNIINENDHVVIAAGTGTDYIWNGGYGVEIYGGDGDDRIINHHGYGVMILGGSGNDSIRSYGSNVTIYGGDGDDLFELFVGQNDGRDVVVNDYEKNDKLRLNWRFLGSSLKGNDVLVEVDDDKMYNNILSEKITLKNAKDKEITVIDSTGKEIKFTNTYDGSNSGGGSAGGGNGGGGDKNNTNPTTDDVPFTEALKSILDAVGTWGNVGSATTAKEAISYIETLTNGKKSNDNLLENIFNLATSGVGAFGGIYTVIDNYVVKNSPTNQILQTSKTGKPFDEKIFGEAAKKNIAFVSVIANIFGLASSMSKAGYKLEEKTLHEALDDFAGVAESIASSSASIADLKNAINAVEVSKAGPWSAVNIYLALTTGAIGIVQQSAQSFSKYYYDDNKWDFNDTAEFLIDVSLSGLYGISHTLTLGLDDIIWNTLNGWKDTGGKSFPEIAADNIKNFARNLGNQVNVFISNFKEGVEKVIDGLKLAGTLLTVLTSNINSVWLGSSANFSDVKTVDGKSNNKDIILAGNSNANSIVGGNGRNSLWGGASGNNTLTGGTARDQFWYGGNGKDIVTNFSAGNGANNDVVVLFGGELSGVNRSGANVALNMSNGNAINLKTNSSSAEDVIQYSTDGNNIFGAKIGASNTKSLNYDGSVNYFQLNGGGTLNVTGAGENNVWLDGSQGQAFSGISNINATGNGKNILAGNGENNSIISGTGESSLWGGAGNSADTLTGGNGADMFWYGKNDGDDIVNNASSGDVVNLYDVSLADITTATASGNKISVTFNTGGHLHIDSAENLSPTFNLADGSWKFNHSSGNWQNA